MKKTQILAVTPGMETAIDRLGLSVSARIGGKKDLCSTFPDQPFQGAEVSFDHPWTACCDFFVPTWKSNNE